MAQDRRLNVPFPFPRAGRLIRHVFFRVVLKWSVRHKQLECRDIREGRTSRMSVWSINKMGDKMGTNVSGIDVQGGGCSQLWHGDLAVQPTRR